MTEAPHFLSLIHIFGHTGIFDAAVAAVEAVDTCIGKTVDAILAQGGAALITADHGNADQMYEADGSPFTAHTTNLVPVSYTHLDVYKRQVAACEKPADFHVLYDEALPIQEKIETIAHKIYHAGSVLYTKGAEKAIRDITALGFGNLPICIAKTQYSLSDLSLIHI